jgi:Fe2+ transport system protein FeoA
MTLEELPSGRSVTIIGLDNGKSFRKKLASLNIRVGKRIRKVTEQPFHGPIVIEIDHTEVTIGRHMAQKILVEPLAEE